MDIPKRAVEPQEITKDGITYEIEFRSIGMPLRRYPIDDDLYFEPGIGPYGVGEIRLAKDYPVNEIRTIYRIKQ
jgi:hypothetical protein